MADFQQNWRSAIDCKGHSMSAMSEQLTFREKI